MTGDRRRSSFSRAVLIGCVGLGVLAAVHFGLVIRQGVARRNDPHDQHRVTEEGAVGLLRTLVWIQAQFYEGDRDGDGEKDFATSLDELIDAGLVEDFRQSCCQGYRYEVEGEGLEFIARAIPDVEREKWGLLSKTRPNFLVSEDGIVRYAPAGERATRESPAWKD